MVIKWIRFNSFKSYFAVDFVYNFHIPKNCRRFLVWTIVNNGVSRRSWFMVLMFNCRHLWRTKQGWNCHHLFGTNSKCMAVHSLPYIWKLKFESRINHHSTHSTRTLDWHILKKKLDLSSDRSTDFIQGKPPNTVVHKNKSILYSNVMIQYSSAKQDRKNRLSTHKTHNAQHIYARTAESNPISYLHNIYFHSENFLDYDSSILSTHPPPHCTVLYRFYLISCSTAKSTSLFTFKKKVSR